MAFTERYVTSGAAGGGDGSSGSPWTLAESLTSAVAGDRVNIQSDAGYSLGTDTVTGAGTTAAMIAFRGYNSTIGDLEGQGRNADGSLDVTNFPIITLTGTLTANTRVLFEAISFVGSVIGAIVGNTTVDNYLLIQCKVHNTENNPIAAAVLFDNEANFINCDFECSGAAHAAVVRGDVNGFAFGCRFKGVANISLFRLQRGVAIDCAFIGNATGTGILWETTNSPNLSYGNTFYNLGTDISYPNSAPVAIPIQINNHATDSTKYIDNLYSGTANLAIIEINNRTRDNTTPRTGVGDGANIGEITTDTGGIASDYTDAGNDDLTLISAAPGKAAGMVAYTDCGAYQRQEPAGGGGGGGALIGAGGLVG